MTVNVPPQMQVPVEIPEQAPIETTQAPIPRPVSVPAQKYNTTSSVIHAAKPDATLIDKGEVGIVIYALLFVIAMLMLLIFSDKMIARSISRENAKSMEKVADALNAMRVKLSIGTRRADDE